MIYNVPYCTGDMYSHNGSLRCFFFFLSTDALSALILSKSTAVSLALFPTEANLCLLETCWVAGLCLQEKYPIRRVWFEVEVHPAGLHFLSILVCSQAEKLLHLVKCSHVFIEDENQQLTWCQK